MLSRRRDIYVMVYAQHLEENSKKATGRRWEQLRSDYIHLEAFIRMTVFFILRVKMRRGKPEPSSIYIQSSCSASEARGNVMEEALGGGHGLVVAEGLHLELAAEEREICLCRIPLESIFWSGTSPSWFRCCCPPQPGA